jgi:pilus assembly protein Flp/PilA
MRSLKRILKDDRGANAIEYAVIAALIGVGLIGSLTATRGSLSAIFGVASSKMANSDAGTGSSGGTTAPTSNPLFASKTLSSRTPSTRVWGANQYDYTYSDGSTATYMTGAAYRGSYYRSNLQMKDAATGLSYSYVPSEVDPTSGQTLTQNLGTVSYYASGNQKTYTSYSFDPNGTTMTGTVQNYADQAGASGTAGGTVTAQVSQFQSVIDQYNAYKANP